MGGCLAPRGAAEIYGTGFLQAEERPRAGAAEPNQGANAYKPPDLKAEQRAAPGLWLVRDLQLLHKAWRGPGELQGHFRARITPHQGLHLSPLGKKITHQ